MEKKCDGHPRYKARRAPRSRCLACWNLWINTPMSHAKALSMILQWHLHPETQQDVPGNDMLNQWRYREKVRRTIMGMIVEAKKGTHSCQTS